MTNNDTITIIGSLGFPIFLILAVMLFIDKRLFPAVLKYWQERSAEEMLERKLRHGEYIDSQRAQTAALDRLGDITESFVLSLNKIDVNVMRNHAEVMARIELLRKRDTGPLPPPGKANNIT